MATISESTKVRLGVMLTILFGGIGFAFATIWWAATVQSKLDTVVVTLKSLETLSSAAHDLDKRYMLLEHRVQVLENRVQKTP